MRRIFPFLLATNVFIGGERKAHFRRSRLATVCSIPVCAMRPSLLRFRIFVLRVRAPLQCVDFARECYGSTSFDIKLMPQVIRSDFVLLKYYTDAQIVLCN